MGLHARIVGGTNGGTRRPFDGTPRPWHCKCVTLPDAAGTIFPKTNIGALVRCLDCGTWRSEGVPA